MTKDKKTQQGNKKPGEVIPPDAAKELEEAFGSKKAESLMSVITQSRVTMSGPLPLSSEFAAYDEVLPGAAREVLDMAKKEQEHRHSLESRDLKWSVGHQFISLLGGITLLLTCIGGAIYLALHNQPVIAGLIVGVAVLGVVTAIVRARPSFSGREQSGTTESEEENSSN